MAISASLEVLQLFGFRHHVGCDLVEPERCRAMRTDASETDARLRHFPKIFNDFWDHELPA